MILRQICRRWFHSVLIQYYWFKNQTKLNGSKWNRFDLNYVFGFIWPALSSHCELHRACESEEPSTDCREKRSVSFWESV